MNPQLPPARRRAAHARSAHACKSHHEVALISTDVWHPTRPQDGKRTCEHPLSLDVLFLTTGFIQPVPDGVRRGFVAAFGLGFTPHIQGQPCTDLHLRAHAVDVLLHLAIAPVAPLYCIGRRGEQRIIEKRQRFFQRGAKSFFSVSPRKVNRWTRRRSLASLSRAVWVRQRRSNKAYTCSMIARNAWSWGNPWCYATGACVRFCSGDVGRTDTDG